MAKWQKLIRLLFFYTLAVFVIEYIVIYSRFVTYRNNSDSDYIVGDHKRMISLNKSEFYEFLSSPHTNNRSLELVNDTRDWSRLHMIQMRLLSCVHSDGNILQCLEEAFLKERREENLKKAKRDTHNYPERPSDDPKLVDEYYDRRRYTKKVNEFKYDFILTPRKTCDNKTYMIILVHSFHPYHDRRTAIRSTWGGAATGHHTWPRRAINKKIILLFVLGIHSLPDMNSAIEKESQQFGDIIQGTFFDAYVNLTLKSLLGLKYVSMYCKKIEYLLKSDDDMIINMPYLLTLLDEKKMKRSIMGPLNRGSKVYRMGKWMVRREDFPLKYYPQYESGAAYVMTNDIVADLYNISHYIPRFNVDDAYITGVLGKIIGIHHEEQQGFAFWTDKSPSACDILENKKVTGTKMTPAKLKTIWNDLRKGTSCQTRRIV
ncbi:hypothetical protein LSH36_994g01053 [Paralvinella palmiformis]|uniref:Hexosyltransferase n=1 Tax=Paralvinella palmiformis TaxID=53620 RepID=A0AAD9IWZ0_9ANNE|nr:hypothetical protein LSH36_994g01053 [Paralvinella palmiformis]